MCGCCSVPAPTPAPGPTASRRWRPPSTLATRIWSTCSPSTASSRRPSGPMPRAAGWILSGPVSIPTAGCGPTPRCRAPTPPTSSLSHPRIPAAGNPEEIMAEAFVYACQHGRTEVVRWFLDRGQNPDVAPFLGQTGLHLAILHQRPEVVRLLLERGADPSLRDEFLHADADGLVRLLFATMWRDPVVRQIRKLIKSRSRLVTAAGA